MAIRDFKIGLQINDPTIDCDGSTTIVANVIVAITTDGTFTRYAVSLWDHNVLESDDQLGERQIGRIEAMDPILEYRQVHKFELSCTDDCRVKGDYGEGRKTYAWVYAYGQEWDYMLSQPYTGGQEVSTGSVTVECAKREKRRAE